DDQGLVRLRERGVLPGTDGGGAVTVAGDREAVLAAGVPQVVPGGLRLGQVGRSGRLRRGEVHVTGPRQDDSRVEKSHGRRPFGMTNGHAPGSGDVVRGYW